MRTPSRFALGLVVKNLGAAVAAPSSNVQSKVAISAQWEDL